jgi:hypothetical protein
LITPPSPEATKALAGETLRCCEPVSRSASGIFFSSACHRLTVAHTVDEHARDLRQAGESNERLDGLAGWRKSPYFTEPEKAALEWAEVLTQVDVTHAPDAAYEPLARHYDSKQVANITYAIALMNAWNRVAIGFHQVPRSNRRIGAP